MTAKFVMELCLVISVMCRKVLCFTAILFMPQPHNQTLSAINQFVDDNALYRCDSLFGSRDKQCTYHNEAQGSGSTIDYFLINARNAVILLLQLKFTVSERTLALLILVM